MRDPSSLISLYSVRTQRTFAYPCTVYSKLGDYRLSRITDILRRSATRDVAISAPVTVLNVGWQEMLIAILLCCVARIFIPVSDHLGKTVFPDEINHRRKQRRNGMKGTKGTKAIKPPRSARK